MVKTKPKVKRIIGFGELGDVVDGIMGYKSFDRILDEYILKEVARGSGQR